MAALLCWANETVPDQTLAAGEPLSKAESRPAIPFKAEDAGLPAGVGRILAIMVFLLFAAGAVAYLMRRLHSNPIVSGRRIELIEARRLSALLTIYLVRVQGNTYILSQSGNQVVLLDKIESPESPSSQ